MESMFHSQYKKRNTRIWGGLFLLGLGVILLLREMGVFFPSWVFSWPLILIIIGTFLGVSSGFKGPAWLIMLFIGCVFLFDEIAGHSVRRYSWPIVIMIIGAVLIFRPRKLRWDQERSPGSDDQQRFSQGQVNTEPAQQYTANAPTPNMQSDASDYIDSAAVFGGVKKVVFSKNFKGGDVVSVFGGHDINLSKADFQGTAELELTQVFGGTKLIVPSHWNIRSEVVAFLGGIEDKRLADGSAIDPSKTLILKGTTVLGGIEIKNY